MGRKKILGIAGGLLVFVLLIPALASAEPDPTYIWTDELLTNPGFETGDKTGWTDGGGGSMDVGYCCTSCDNGPHSGSYQAYWETSNSGYYAYQDVDLSPFAIHIDAGDAVVNATGWLISNEYNPSPSPYDQFYMQVIFYDEGGNVTSTYDTGTTNNATWEKYGVENYTIPSGARKVQIRFNTWETASDAGSADDFSVKVGIESVSINLEGWGWGPIEEKGVGNVTFPAQAIITPRVIDPNISDIRFVGTLNLTYPDTSTVTFDLDLSGVKTRSIFYLGQHKVNNVTGNVEWEAAFMGSWLTWDTQGQYINCAGSISEMPGQGPLETTNPYFLELRMPNVQIPDPQLPTTGNYTANLDYLIKWTTKRFDDLLTQLTHSNFREILGDMLDRAVVIIKEVRNLIGPYIP